MASCVVTTGDKRQLLQSECVCHKILFCFIEFIKDVRFFPKFTEQKQGRRNYLKCK